MMMMIIIIIMLHLTVKCIPYFVKNSEYFAVKSAHKIKYILL